MEATNVALALLSADKASLLRSADSPVHLGAGNRTFAGNTEFA
jgi:hypothetical protein